MRAAAASSSSVRAQAALLSTIADTAAAAGSTPGSLAPHGAATAGPVEKPRHIGTKANEEELRPGDRSQASA